MFSSFDDILFLKCSFQHVWIGALTIDYCKNSTTSYLLAIEHMAIFVGKPFYTQINGHVMHMSFATPCTF